MKARASTDANRTIDDQGISEYHVMTVHAQVPECPQPMEGPAVSILRQCIFEVLFK